MSLRHGLLGLINNKPRTGYDLNKFFQVPLQHFWTVQTSQIYKELSELEKRGMLGSEIVVQTSSPNRKVYHITESGRAELLRWLADASTFPVLEAKDPFMLKFFFAGELDWEECIKMLIQFKAKCKAALAVVDTVDADVKQREKDLDKRKTLTRRLVRQFGRQVLELKLSWAEESLKILEKENADLSQC